MWSTHVQQQLRLRAFACLLATCLVAACGSSPSAPTAASTPATVRQVVVLGDSLAVTPSVSESFPAVLQTRVAGAGLPWTVMNADRCGVDSRDERARRHPSECRRRPADWR